MRRARLGAGAAVGALVLLAACAPSLSGQAPLGSAEVPAEPGVFDQSTDVGGPALAGASVMNGAGQYRLTGGGANIWGTADQFRFLYTRRSGNLHIASRIDWEGEGANPHRKAGPMIRANLTPGSPYADVMLHGDGLVSLQFRERQDGPTREIVSNMRRPAAVRLEYEDGYVYFSLAGQDGVFRHAGGNYRIAFPGEYLAGLALSSHDDAVTETALFSDVELRVPTLRYIADTGYPAAVESTLEIIGIAESASRRVVRHFDGKIEAPNWTREGAALIYNSGGLLYRIPVGGGEPVRIDTGPQVANNNDHGISPDGQWLAISDQSHADGQSRIYRLPIGGSAAPELVMGVDGSPSYWHGWTPDGKTVVYTANRPDVGDYELYATDIEGGPERRLTFSPGLDDGPEYSPDGQYLYFNSTRSGAMQIWRSAPDGTKPEQVTRDPAFRDWFPHVSPDGKWIVFVAFGQDIELSDHPPNRDVWLKIMPADGSAPPRVLTRLFGGQGTINVPSWSPDSTHVAFVSYRLVR